MQKLLSTLLTIIFFQTSIFAFPVAPFLFNPIQQNSCFQSSNLPILKSSKLGAVIASETDNLTLDTGKLKYSDIKDYDTQNSSNIGFTVSDGQYDNESILRTGNEHDTLTTKITLKDQGQEKEQLTKATIGNGKIIVGGQEQTEEDLQGLNRDVNNSQTITKDQITAALDAELNVDVKLLVSLVDAIYNGDPNKISVVKDYKKVKEKIQEILVERRRTELEKNIKKIKFSKDKEKQKEIEEKLQLDEEIIKLQTANDNKKILKEYLKKNKLSSEVIEQIEKIGATGEYYFEINSEGKLYAVKTSEADSARNNIFLSTDYLYNDITTNEKFLNIFLPGSYEEIYASTMREASKSMAEILLETSPQLRNISNDTNQIVKDTGNLILEMAKSSGDKQTYKTALKAIKEIPNNIKETYTATTKASNVENLQQIGYSIGDKAYDYKENPMLLAKDATSLFISYDMYEAGFNNDNMFYATGLIVGGLALDIAGAPIKAGKGIVKTAKVTEKVANAGKGMTKAIVPYYPPNNGALLGTERRIILQPGTVIDRYGDLNGKYLSPIGTPLEMRALPPTTKISEYSQFVILKPLEVDASMIAPAFNKIGLGTQYKTKDTINELLEKKFIKEIGVKEQ